MTENKRFTYGTNERWDDVLIDNLEKKEYSLYFLDELCNKLWEQTKRFEKHNKELSEENEQLKQRINSRLHFYRELYDSTKDSIVKRVVEDLEDILKR